MQVSERNCDFAGDFEAADCKSSWCAKNLLGGISWLEWGKANFRVRHRSWEAQLGRFAEVSAMTCGKKDIHRSSQGQSRATKSSPLVHLFYLVFIVSDVALTQAYIDLEPWF